MGIQGDLNRLIGKTDPRDFVGETLAANILAGTKGLGYRAALNIAAGNGTDRTKWVSEYHAYLALAGGATPPAGGGGSTGGGTGGGVTGSSLSWTPTGGMGVQPSADGTLVATAGNDYSWANADVGGFPVEVEFDFTSEGSGNTYAIFSPVYDGSHDLSVMFNDNRAIGWRDFPQSSNGDFTFAIPAGQTIHVKTVFDRTTGDMHIFRDGTPTGDFTFTPAEVEELASATKVRFGGYVAGNNYRPFTYSNIKVKVA